jgi:hypothetical protein
MDGKCPPTKEGFSQVEQSYLSPRLLRSGSACTCVPPKESSSVQKTVFVGDGIERGASTRRMPPATFLPGRCHRWPRGWPQRPVRTTTTSSAAARQLSRSKMIALVSRSALEPSARCGSQRSQRSQSRAPNNPKGIGASSPRLACNAYLGCAFRNRINANGVGAEVRCAGGNEWASTALRLGRFVGR